MKQTSFTLLLVVLLSMVGLPVFADWDTSTTIQVGTLYYYLDKDNSQAQVTSMPSGKYTGAIVIPSSITHEAKTYNVTRICGFAFDGCSGLTSITIPNSVTSIGAAAFQNCKSLTSITIPSSVTSIGRSAFPSCSGLTSIKVESGNTMYDSRNNCNAIIETASNTLLTGCKNTTIPNSVTSIGEDAFWCCSGLTSVTIPNSVTSIGDGAFHGCKGLTSITIPNSVTSIGNVAFSECSSLKSVTIGNSVKTIGWMAFSGCSGLTSITIPNGVTSIGHAAFQDCTSLASVTIGNSMTSIEGGTFVGCESLTSVTIGKSVTSIGASAFSSCGKLTSITIPSSVKSIGERAFYWCTKLTSVTVLNPNPVTIDESVFHNRTNATLYVRKGSKYAYQSADYWKEFKAIKEISIPIYKLIYIVDGKKYKSYDIYEGDDITPEPAPTKEGYTFSGWSETPATMPAEDVIVTGTFGVKNYELTYSVDGLSKMKMNVPTIEHKLNITAEEGWKVVALTVNGEDKMSSLKNNVLTINISADTDVKVTLGWANEANLYTEDPATGIATIEGEGVKVQAKDGQIWVDGAAGKTVRLYTIGGALMTTVTPTAGNTGKFSVAPGTYIIQVGNKAAKVTVK